MVQKENDKDVQQLPVLTSEEYALVVKTIDSVFEADFDKALPLVEHLINTLNPQTTGTAFKTLQSVLKTIWNYFKAINLVRTEGNFIEAYNLFHSSAEGFNVFGFKEFRDLSIGMMTYASAVIELRKSNIGQALEYLTNVKKYLKSEGKYSNKYNFFIDHIEPEMLFVSGIKALNDLDYATAKTLIDRASQVAEQVAHNYYQEGKPMYYTFKGYSLLYKAIYTFCRAENEFNQFEYDKLAARQDLANEAIQAKELLDKGDIENVMVKNSIHIANAIANLLQVIGELSSIMQRVFRSTFKPDIPAIARLKQKIDIAENSFSKAGYELVPLIRHCGQLYSQVNNLQWLAKPNKKDFGALSGLVSCSLFLPLFLVVTWANSTFGIKLKGSTIIEACISMALIGGFGFGALKFKSLFFSSRNKKS